MAEGITIKSPDVGANVPGRVNVGEPISATSENRVRAILAQLVKNKVQLTGKAKQVANLTSIDFPPFSVIETLGSSMSGRETLAARRPARAGLARVLFTRAQINAGTSGVVYEGGIQVAYCADAVVGGYALTTRDRFTLQPCTVGPFRILARLVGVSWLTGSDDFVLVDVAGEKDTGIMVTKNAVDPRPFRVIDFVGFGVTDNGNGTITIS